LRFFLFTCFQKQLTIKKMKYFSKFAAANFEIKVLLSRRKLNKTVRKKRFCQTWSFFNFLLTWLSSSLQQQWPQFFSRIIECGFEGSSLLKNCAFLPSQLWFLLFSFVALIAGWRSWKINESIFIVPSIEASLLIVF